MGESSAVWMTCSQVLPTRMLVAVPFSVISTLRLDHRSTPMMATIATATMPTMTLRAPEGAERRRLRPEEREPPVMPEASTAMPPARRLPAELRGRAPLRPRG